MSSLATQQPLGGLVARGVAWFFLNGIVNKFSGLVTSLLKITHLTMFQYGLLTLTISVVFLINGIVNTGLQNFVLVDLNKAKGKGDMQEYKALLIGFIKGNVVLAFSGWALLFFGSTWIASFYSNDIWRYLRFFSFFVIISPFVNLYLILLRTHLQFKAMTVWSVVGSYVNLLLVAVLVVVFDQGIYGVLWAELLYHLFLLIIFTPQVYRHGAYLFTIPRAKKSYIWLHLKEHGKWAVFGNFFSDFSRRLRPWFVAFFLSVEAVAVYAVAKSMYSHIIGITPISQVMDQVFPQQVDHKEKMKELYLRSVKYGMYLYLALMLASIFAMPLFTVWLFPQYVSSLPLFYIILILLPFQSVGVLQNTLLYTLRKQKAQLFIRIAQSACIVIFSVIFLQLFGLVGAAWEFVIVGVITILMRYWYLLKYVPYTRIRPHIFFIYDDLDKQLLRAIVRRIKSKVFFLKTNTDGG